MLELIESQVLWKAVQRKAAVEKVVESWLLTLDGSPGQAARWGWVDRTIVP